jgi:hypothetical protein
MAVAEAQVSDLTYPLAVSTWPKDGVASFWDRVSERRICSIPIAFLRVSGENNWTYVWICLRCCANLSESQYVILLQDRPMSSQHPILPGSYTLVRRTDDSSSTSAVPTSAIQLRRGPIGKRRGRPAQSSPGASTMSDSKRSTTNQVWVVFATLASPC